MIYDKWLADQVGTNMCGMFVYAQTWRWHNGRFELTRISSTHLILFAIVNREWLYLQGRSGPDNPCHTASQDRLCNQSRTALGYACDSPFWQ